MLSAERGRSGVTCDHCAIRTHRHVVDEVIDAGEVLPCRLENLVTPAGNNGLTRAYEGDGGELFLEAGLGLLLFAAGHCPELGHLVRPGGSEGFAIRAPGYIHDMAGVPLELIDQFEGLHLVNLDIAVAG